MARRPSLPHVALLIETSRTYARAILRGVRDYVATHGPWSVYLEARAPDSALPRWLPRWRGDGILTRTFGKAMARAILRTGAPAVELRATRLDTGFPFVGVDNRAIGRMTAEHFLERGFRSFGCLEFDAETYFEQRRDDFVRSVQARGHPCSLFRLAGRREKPMEWERQQEALARWVRGLPKPVGLMACTDQLGFWLIDACARGGIRVPEEAAVVGVEDDESLCSMSRPSLSSVRFNGERTGYVAAEILARLMAGRRPPATPVLVEPLGIVARQSSDVLAIPDRPVADALRFIRERACSGITVDDVVRAVPLSRSALERRMRSAIGRSPKAEIQRVRFAEVCRLLSTTDLPVSAVAGRTGFNHFQYLCESFKREMGETPGAYRARTRRASDT
ncbi:MAG TPA: XylR family transcriptional regulator [Planctomycetota bacterium]|nr:XylR family transcriptional regulator [Planctomycetota bacterium]